MGDYDKGQGKDQGQDGKPGFDKQQQQQGGKPDQGQDKGGDFGKPGQDQGYGDKPQQQ